MKNWVVEGVASEVNDFTANASKNQIEAEIDLKWVGATHTLIKMQLHKTQAPFESWVNRVKPSTSETSNKSF